MRLKKDRKKERKKERKKNHIKRKQGRKKGILRNGSCMIVVIENNKQ